MLNIYLFSLSKYVKYTDTYLGNYFQSILWFSIEKGGLVRGWENIEIAYGETL